MRDGSIARDMQDELFHAGLYIDGLRAEWADQK